MSIASLLQYVNNKFHNIYRCHSNCCLIDSFYCKREKKINKINERNRLTTDQQQRLYLRLHKVVNV